VVVSVNGSLFLAFDGKRLKVSAEDHNHWVFVYPSVDHQQEYYFADAWLEANPKRRKRNLRRFMANWLNKEERRVNEQKKETRVGAAPEGAISEERKRLYLTFENEKLNGKIPRTMRFTEWLKKEER